MAIDQKLKNIIVETLEVSDTEKVVESANIRADLGADDLGFTELVIGLEEGYGITIAEDQSELFVTVGDIVAYISKNKKS